VCTHSNKLQTRGESSGQGAYGQTKAQFQPPDVQPKLFTLPKVRRPPTPLVNRLSTMRCVRTTGARARAQRPSAAAARRPRGPDQARHRLGTSRPVYACTCLLCHTTLTPPCVHCSSARRWEFRRPSCSKVCSQPAIWPITRVHPRIALARRRSASWLCVAQDDSQIIQRRNCSCALFMHSMMYPRCYRRARV
jgi:cytochrome c5